MKYESIGSDLFVSNRKRLLKELPKGAIAVFNSNDHMPTNADGTMPFRQNSDLFYLTGIQQEESYLVICPDFPDKNLREVLFLRKPNELLEKWEGHKLTKQEAKEVSGITTVRWNNEFDKLFHHMMVMGGVSNVYLNTNEHYRSNVIVETRDARFIEWCKNAYPLHRYERVAPLMAKLRAIKQKREIELMQIACDITEKGFRRILQFVKPGVMEYEIEAEYIHEFIRNRSRGFAYEPIIASGANNCVLHYIDNSRKCKAGDLILLDVAAEYANYNSDLTRTIPVSGKFTKRQKEVYNAVLRVMRGAIKLLGPTTNFFDYQKKVEKMMEEELLKLKLITKAETIAKNPGNPGFRKYFYHGTSHLIGLDVHDVGDMHAKMPLCSIWTVEPGIYIQEEGFGVRLENNLVIQKSGVLDLMKNIPVEADEIEDLMNSK
ncbi:MAG TPA: Xaa-Pro aminopeptidase [Cyclobacteriaceae bacterium]